MHPLKGFQPLSNISNDMEEQITVRGEPVEPSDLGLKKDGGTRVRFAPSPTGHLHIGGLRSAIFNWLFARHHNGTFLLRIEDTDLERSKQEYTDSILASFAWMGIDWDEPLVIQSQRIERHRQIAQQLLKEKKAYYCNCAPEAVVERLRHKPGYDPDFIRYDSFCATRNLTSGAIRFAISSEIQLVEWNDLIRGHISINRDQLDDFIIVRSDGTPMYNFVVVVDDADMRISHVIRGEEHIANTPKQILLYQACTFKLPEFAHLPMILGPDGSKLSKRDAATGVFEYKQQGYLHQALFNYLVRLGWAHGDQEIFTKDEMINYFSLDHVGKKGAIFDQNKLDWINGVYLRESSDQDLLDLIIKDIYPTLRSDLSTWHDQTILLLINIYKQRAKTLVELVTDIKALYKKPSVFPAHDLTQWITPDAMGYLQELISILSNIQTFDADHITSVLKEWTKSKNIKIVAIAQPLRIALLGKSSGPSVFELMAVIGKHATVERIEHLIQSVEK